MEGFFSKEKILQMFGRGEKKQKSKATRKGTEYNCERCRLHETCKSPRMRPHGKFRKEGLIWAEAPGKTEDEKGYQLCGESGDIIRKVFKKFGMDMDVDFVKTNSLDCRPPENRKPTTIELRCCYTRKKKFLEQFKPKVILLLGDKSLESFYQCNPERSFMDLGISSLRGKVIPDYEMGAWICHSYHPAFLLRGNMDKIHVFEKDIKTFVDLLGQPRPELKIDTSYKFLTVFNDIKYCIKTLIKSKVPVTFDYETSSFRYHEKIHSCYVVGAKKYGEQCFVFPLKKKGDVEFFLSAEEMREVRILWKKFLRSRVPKVAQNIKHEHKAGRWLFNAETKNWHWCSLMGNRTLDEAYGVNDLKMQAYINFGYPRYDLPQEIMEADPKEKNKIETVPGEKVAEYCSKDVIFSEARWKQQEKKIKEEGLQKAYTLLHKGALAFADMEDQAIRLDMEFLSSLKSKWTREFDSLREKHLSCSEARKFKDITNRDLKFNKQTAREDLKTILFKILKLPVSKSIDEEFLSKYVGEHPFIKREIQARKILKRMSYLDNFERFQVDGFLYPSFWLDIAATYRSSSREPNFQNIVKRDEEGKIIRKIIVARDGHVILEVDYSGMEVRILACWSKDKKLIEFIRDGFDMHGFWGTELYGVKKGDDRWKELRYAAKNGFVFANFYGSFYENTAIDTWNYMTDQEKKQWRFKEWVGHVKDCEDKFWRMFKGVREKQFDAVREYKEKGYMEMIGWNFRRHGYLKRNHIFNSHIQGPAFLCLLKDLIDLNQIRKKEQWRTKMPGQIHDAIFFDANKKEKENVIDITNYVMTKKLVKDNPWIIVPLETEWEEGPNWLDMKELKVAA